MRYMSVMQPYLQTGRNYSGVIVAIFSIRFSFFEWRDSAILLIHHDTSFILRTQKREICTSTRNSTERAQFFVANHIFIFKHWTGRAVALFLVRCQLKKKKNTANPQTKDFFYACLTRHRQNTNSNSKKWQLNHWIDLHLTKNCFTNHTKAADNEKKFPKLENVKWIQGQQAPQIRKQTVLVGWYESCFEFPTKQ